MNRTRIIIFLAVAFYFYIVTTTIFYQEILNYSQSFLHMHAYLFLSSRGRSFYNHLFGRSVCLCVKKISKLLKRLKLRDFDKELETKDVSQVEQTLNFIFGCFTLSVCWSVHTYSTPHILLTTHTQSFMFDFSHSCFYKKGYGA